MYSIKEYKYMGIDGNALMKTRGSYIRYIMKRNKCTTMWDKVQMSSSELNKM